MEEIKRGIKEVFAVLRFWFVLFGAVVVLAIVATFALARAIAIFALDPYVVSFLAIALYGYYFGATLFYYAYQVWGRGWGILVSLTALGLLAYQIWTIPPQPVFDYLLLLGLPLGVGLGFRVSSFLEKRILALWPRLNYRK